MSNISTKLNKIVNRTIEIAENRDKKALKDTFNYQSLLIGAATGILTSYSSGSITGRSENNIQNTLTLALGSTLGALTGSFVSCLTQAIIEEMNEDKPKSE